MNLPYLQEIQIWSADYVCWLVDGKYVRDNLNIDFTNFGQAPLYPQVPANELWIDNTDGKVPEEAPFYIANMLAERQALKRGLSIEQAREYGDKIERRERGKIYGRHAAMAPDKLFELVKLHTLGEDEWGITHWLVDGDKVRTYSGYIDWVEGGHDKVYPFILPDMIWIDNETSQDEMLFIRLHESYERQLMEGGMAYPEAHRHASAAELEARHRFDIWGN
jgi:hypothetical protein